MKIIKLNLPIVQPGIYPRSDGLGATYVNRSTAVQDAENLFELTGRKREVVKDGKWWRVCEK